VRATGQRATRARAIYSDIFRLLTLPVTAGEFPRPNLIKKRRLLFRPATEAPSSPQSLDSDQSAKLPPCRMQPPDTLAGRRAVGCTQTAEFAGSHIVVADAPYRGGDQLLIAALAVGIRAVVKIDSDLARTTPYRSPLRRRALYRRGSSLHSRDRPPTPRARAYTSLCLFKLPKDILHGKTGAGIRAILTY